MKMFAYASAALCAAAVLLPAQAAPQTWTIAGPVSPGLFDNGNLTAGATTYSVDIVVDTNAPDLEPADPGVGRYATTSTVTIGALSESYASEMVVSNDVVLSGVTGDLLQFLSVGAPPAGWDSWLAQAQFSDLTTTTFASDAIPAAGLSEADFDFGEFGINAILTGGQFGVIGVNQAETFTTPEPASLGVIALALPYVSCRSRRQRR